MHNPSGHPVGSDATCLVQRGHKETRDPSHLCDLLKRRDDRTLCVYTVSLLILQLMRIPMYVVLFRGKTRTIFTRERETGARVFPARKIRHFIGSVKYMTLYHPLTSQASIHPKKNLSHDPSTPYRDVLQCSYFEAPESFGEQAEATKHFRQTWNKSFAAYGMYS